MEVITRKRSNAGAVMGLLRFTIAVPIVFPICTLAGEIEGTLYGNDRPIANECISICCESEDSQCACDSESSQCLCESQDLQCETTDLNGYFRFYIAHTGTCQIRIPHPVTGRDLTHRVYSYIYPVRYDFDLTTNAEGQYRLRRH